MGYTHYFENNSINKKSWSAFIEDVQAIIKQAPSEIALDVVINDKDISINGVDDDSHETLYINRDTTSDFEFCKTARKPYDLVVAAILVAYEEHNEDATVRSDGDLHDGEWVDAFSFLTFMNESDLLTFDPLESAVYKRMVGEFEENNSIGWKEDRGSLVHHWDDMFGKPKGM